MLELQFGQASDRGERELGKGDAMGWFIPDSRQQAQSHGYLFAVADGCGGQGCGEGAAATAISVLTGEFEKARPGAMLISLLPELIQTANSEIHRGGHGGPPNGKGRATVVACALRHDQAIVSHVGDSRCYLVRNGFARQVTQDAAHEPAKEAGYAKAEGIDGKNGMRRMLGREAMVLPDTIALTLLAGDVLVLSTDGLHERMSSEHIARIASQAKSAGEIARELVSCAVEADGKDDTTAQVIRVRAVDQTGAYRCPQHGMRA
ncbi:MAG TPA: protein phosphatase 2C domain-containing protein [Terracidiphilus sp.]|nr:protein phosphatase 2C domain-containing protein [Terracidiphilus sp.]